MNSLSIDRDEYEEARRLAVKHGGLSLKGAVPAPSSLREGDILRLLQRDPRLTVDFEYMAHDYAWVSVKRRADVTLRQKIDFNAMLDFVTGAKATLW